MNSVLAFKQFGLSEGLAELLAPEIKNMDVFKASIKKTAQNFCNVFGYDQCHDKTYDKHENGHDKSKC